MRILPGRAATDLRSTATVELDGTWYFAYTSGKALVIASEGKDLVQTLYHDDPLHALSFDAGTGKIAVASPSAIHIYTPTPTPTPTRATMRWEPSLRIETPDATDPVTSLSWGINSELLVSSASVSLWDTKSTGPREIWCKSLANPLDVAMFSYDATFIASVSHRNRFVKIWRRQAYALGAAEFDFSYLPHPHVVTSLCWKKPFHRDILDENILYTLSADCVLRVWSPLDAHEVYPFQLCTSLDLRVNSIAPPVPSTFKHKEQSHPTVAHVVSLIDSKVFTSATEYAALNAGHDPESKQQLQNLVDIARRSSEIILLFHGSGHYSAWGVEILGARSRKTINIFSIVNQVELDWQLSQDSGGPLNVTVLPGPSSISGLSISAQFGNGEIGWFEANLDDLLDPTSSICQFKQSIVWSGHLEPINHLKRTARGNSLLSSSKAWEHVLWRRVVCADTPYLERQSLVSVTEGGHVIKTLILPNGWYVVTLHETHIRLWDCRGPTATELSRCSLELIGAPFSLILLPEYETLDTVYHVFVIDKSLRGSTFAIKIPRPRRRSSVSTVRPEHSSGMIEKHSAFDFPAAGEISMLVPVDPVGWNFTVSDNLDTFNREVAVSITTTGLLQSWTARLSPNTCEIQWLQTYSLETLLKGPSLIGGSSMHKVAIVDCNKTLLTIWDTKNGQLEYQYEFDGEEYVRDLDWTCTPDSQSILAVGFSHKVILFSQLRYDYLNAGPAWAPFQQVDIQGFTDHPIGDSIWLSDGTLVIGCGNQLFVQSKDIVGEGVSARPTPGVWANSSNDTHVQTIFDLASRLNGPLPLYHPQFLQQCILAGKMKLAERIVVELAYTLRANSTSQPIESSLGISPEEFYEFIEQDSHDSKENPRLVDGFTRPDFDQDICSELVSLLKSVPIPYLSGKEQMSLAGIVECMSEEWLHKQSLDEWGARYLLFFKHYHLQTANSHVLTVPGVSFREISWAFQSETQEILIDLVTKTFQGKMGWNQARAAGFFMWLKDNNAVRMHVDILAANQYMRKEERDPVDCSLYYLALRKKAVLLRLWRIAHWNKEQAATTKFLSNNFDDPRWKTAALKNAYALMGKQRFEYAAAFFLLADRPKDAVNVCFTQMNDLQLAVVIARAYDGDDGPVLRELLEEKVLPVAAKDGNKWLASWAFWMLGQKDLAVRSLMMPISSLVSGAETPGVCKIFLADDPALVILYTRIRDKTLKSLRGAGKIPKGAEFDFVLHCARLYDRMGCDVLALDLVRNWTFLDTSLKISGLLDLKTSLTRRRSSYIVDDLAHDFNIKDQLSKSTDKTKLIKPPAAAFEEPTMDSFSHFDF